VFPPEVAARDAAPLGPGRKERRERRRVAPIQGLGCGSKLVDHRPSMPRCERLGVGGPMRANLRGLPVKSGAALVDAVGPFLGRWI
jgi:hypothetical protein